MVRNSKNNIKEFVTNRALQLSISVFVLTSILFSSSLVSNIIYDTVKEEKISDLWAITYLQIESIQNNMLAPLKDNPSKPTLVDSELVTSNLSKSKSDIFRKEIGKFKFHFYQNSGETQIFEKQTKDNGYIHSGEKVLASLFNSISQKENDLDIWVVNRLGELIWTSNSSVRLNEIVETGIFQEFVQSPFNKGLKNFNWRGHKRFGVFSIVENTNLIFFATSNEDYVMANIERAYQQITYIIVAVLILIALITQAFLYYSLRPLKYLMDTANSISEGNFLQDPKWSSFGELKILKEAVVKMGANLYSREKKINDLFVEKIKATKLENELAITETIQNNFTPEIEKIDIPTNIDLAYVYRSADHSGGDWIGVKYFEKSNKLILIVADVVGHGVGSAMYTASISGAFETFSNNDDINCREFLESLNRVIFKLGKGNWPATLGLMEFKLDSSQLTYYSMAHLKPYYVDSSSDKRVKIKQLGGPSDLLGIKLDPTIDEQTVELHEKLSFWISTDGIPEAENPDGDCFGDAAVKKILRKSPNQSVKNTIDDLISDLDKFRINEPMKDDICIAGLKFK